MGGVILLVVEDNGEGINAANTDKLTWGIYQPSGGAWTPKDAEREDDNGAGKRPAAVGFGRDVAFGIVGHQFLVVRVMKRSVNILTRSVMISHCTDIGTPASGFGKKASIRTTFHGDRLSEVVSGT